jgi:hypothetical protein
MATVAQFAKPARANLDVALREFLDVVVIPALVKAYIAECRGENRLAMMPDNVTHSHSEVSLSNEEVP